MLEQAIVIAGSPYPPPEFVLREPFPMLPVVLLQQALPTAKNVLIAEPVGPDHSRIADIAVDPVSIDTAPDQGDRFGRSSVQGARAFGGQFAHQCSFAARESAEYKAPVAT